MPCASVSFYLGGESHARDKVWDKNNICVKIIRAQWENSRQPMSKEAGCCNPGVRVDIILSLSVYACKAKVNPLMSSSLHIKGFKVGGKKKNIIPAFLTFKFDANTDYIFSGFLNSDSELLLLIYFFLISYMNGLDGLTNRPSGINQVWITDI